MFFRNKKAHVSSFSDHLGKVRESGFTVSEQGSKARVSKFGCAATVEDRGAEAPLVGKAGVLVGEEIGLLVDGGFQKFFQTPKGRRIPALAEQLKALHDFQEDLREALGLVSLYNQGLGTTFDQHMYDRVKGRDAQRS
ncbi:MAG TPA: hypothetical protein VER03_22275 [Bryobacteraceae bacterium]|nr:hypothetical protein [Bryobacteraceae bacterium]